jgi:hypothetical protein
MTVAKAQRKIDSREFAEWMALESVEPITDRRGDIQAALVAYFIAQVNSRKRLRPEDFMLRWDDAVFGQGVQTAQDHEALARMMSAAGAGAMRSTGGGGTT